METEVALVDKETDEVYSKMIGSAFYVGQGGWGGPKGMFLGIFFDSADAMYRSQCCELSPSQGQSSRCCIR